MVVKSQVVMKDELADILNSLDRARPDLAEAFNLVRVAVGIEEVPTFVEIWGVVEG